MSRRFVRLGAVPVWSASFPPLELRPAPRTGRHHRLVLLLEGEATITSGRRQVPLHTGDFYYDDGSRPHEIRTGPIRAAGTAVPEALLPLPRDDAARVTGHRIPGGDCAGPPLARFLTQVTRNTGVYRPADGPRLGTVLGSLVAALLARAAEPDAVPPARTPLTARITAYIQQHLGERELTPHRIAATHGISLSYLHRLFEAESETVAAFIRRRRLERARFDLADPAQAGTPVHTISARWGFARATDFARAFRAAYGLTPGDFRRRSYGPYGPYGSYGSCGRIAT
ncbi:helix-turn-helix domain-containing protein [Streptomyces sp. MBT65]|uniref:helix-turn-helix domain-containing protein n=1 Tax=Streptomyces sp. MBT65 TaxID=1488395 RepID=UPI0019093549|nr:helix-turn-helix domain-containing protein [Streptomyces sp. MBT65]MBK3574034.1 helix-turn-helix domain-containing protein [Streptomyces sp. MBT65]